MYKGTFEQDFPELFTGKETIVNEPEVITKEEVNMLDFMKDYKPEKVTDGFEIIKGTFKCIFNFARIEDYSGENPEFQGHKFVRYELEICDGQDKAGRRFWKSVDLDNEDKVKKLANTIWTITGFDFKDEKTLQEALEKLVTFTVEVRAWGWKPKKEDGTDDEPIQQHFIKNIAKEEGTKAESSVPF